MKKKSAAAKATVSYKSKEELGITRERNSVVVDRELNKIIERHGHVTPELIVDEAAKESHPLHSLFIWDDAEAARQHRIARAYDLMIRSGIQSVLTAAPEQPKIIGIGSSMATVRRLLPAQYGTKKFKYRQDVLDDSAARAELIERRLGMLRSWCRENVDIEELAAIRAAILGVLPEAAG